MNSFLVIDRYMINEGVMLVLQCGYSFLTFPFLFGFGLLFHCNEIGYQGALT